MDTPTTAARPNAGEVLERFLASYWTTRTRDNYRFILTRWLAWCYVPGLDPIAGADASALEAFIAELKTTGYAPNTISGGSQQFRRSIAGACGNSWSCATRWS